VKPIVWIERYLRVNPSKEQKMERKSKKREIKLKEPIEKIAILGINNIIFLVWLKVLLFELVFQSRLLKENFGNLLVTLSRYTLALANSDLDKCSIS